ncbi:FAD-binding oxidoreductase [Naasia aerilata]|uniref:FAD-linked oxidase n=1 Tax=Naasia aerilata TaxID=1162966 RepID=A0ABM8GFW1_9MICO|nr:FAD-binding oxidoreductase [Naasia aerilata]BDZ47224.1 FAD-linked oxidase [Naasia aerilata]
MEAASPEDVAAAIRFAGSHGIEVGVRLTGHGIINHLENVLLVHTGRLDELTVHPDEAWVRVGAGVRWDRVLQEAAVFGLAPLAGSSPDVGIVGYLTGGGIGPVARTYGVAADRIRAIEVVTGDGEFRRVTPTEHPDLFWALRGGKGALGIVTAVEFDLVHLVEIYGGAVYFDGADAEKVLDTWAEWCPSLIEEGTTSIAILRLPDVPFVPWQLAGRMSVAVRFAWIGDPADGQRVFAPMLAAAPPVLAMVGPMPYTELRRIHADPSDPLPVHEHAALLDELNDDVLDALLAAAGPDADDCRQLMVEIRQLGGAVAMAQEHASALCHRDAEYSYLSIGIPAGPDAEATIRNAEDIGRLIEPWTTGGTLPNFAASDDPHDVVRTYDRETLERLADLIETYDPDSVLRAARPIREALLLSVPED